MTKPTAPAHRLPRRSFLGLACGAGLAGMLPGCAEAPEAAEVPLEIDIDRLTYPSQYRRAVPEIFATRPEPPSLSKAIVIGSGFGGAVTALRLAQAGIGVTILERGSRWPNDPWRQIFTNETWPDGRGYWFRKHIDQMAGIRVRMDVFGGVLDVTEYAGIDVWRAACVGGGSVVYAGATVQPERDYFDALFEGVVDYDELDRVYYPRARQMLGAAPAPADIMACDSFGHHRVWEDQVRAAGYSPSRVLSTFDWAVVRKELLETSRASCLIGESNLGNSNGAKRDLTKTYLRLAEQTGRAKIYPGQRVLGIGRDAQGRYLVEVESIDPFGNVLSRRTIAGEKLFLAAGSIGSSELLVKARARGDLPNLNEHVGEGWGTNGDTAIVRSWSDLEGARQASSIPTGFTDPTARLPFTMQSYSTPGLSRNYGIIGSLGMILDLTNRGRFVYDAASDRVDLDFPATGNDDAVEIAREVNDAVADASDSVPGFLYVPDVNGSFTAHPLGGAVLGRATDAYGRVLGYDGLYVMDGALVPGNTGAVNPSLTITAIAERNVERILTDDF